MPPRVKVVGLLVTLLVFACATVSAFHQNNDLTRPIPHRHNLGLNDLSTHHEGQGGSGGLEDVMKPLEKRAPPAPEPSTVTHTVTVFQPSPSPSHTSSKPPSPAPSHSSVHSTSHPPSPSPSPHPSTSSHPPSSSSKTTSTSKKPKTTITTPSGILGPTSFHTTTIRPTYTQSFAPSPTNGFLNTTVQAINPRIIYNNNTQWVALVSDTCGGSTTMQTSSANATSLFQFTGSAVYMSFAQNANGTRVAVSVDGEVDVVSTYTINGDGCGYSWSRWNLTNAVHTVQVTVLGLASSTNTSRVGTFELNAFLYSAFSTGAITSTATVTKTSGGAATDIDQSSRQSSLLMTLFVTLMMCFLT